MNWKRGYAISNFAEEGGKEFMESSEKEIRKKDVEAYLYVLLNSYSKLLNQWEKRPSEIAAFFLEGMHATLATVILNDTYWKGFVGWAEYVNMIDFLNNCTVPQSDDRQYYWPDGTLKKSRYTDDCIDQLSDKEPESPLMRTAIKYGAKTN